jgi:magnesium-transporting ATPase (P-type)
MVLTDDNFATIVRAVHQGRTLYDNILKFVRFQLSTTIGAILTIFFAPLAGLPEPLTAVQGDKTQIATVAMAAHYAAPLMVVIGTTLGMLIAHFPAVFAGDKLANKIPMKLVHSIAAAAFAVLGVATLLGAGARSGL